MTGSLTRFSSPAWPGPGPALGATAFIASVALPRSRCLEVALPRDVRLALVWDPGTRDPEPVKVTVKVTVKDTVKVTVKVTVKTPMNTTM